MKKTLSFVAALIIITGCASASYKAREEGITNFGYEQKQLSSNSYTLDYYGARSDSYEKLEKFWHRRAEDICGVKKYSARIKRERYSGQRFIILPVFMYYDESKWPMIKGELLCNTK